MVIFIHWAILTLLKVMHTTYEGRIFKMNVCTKCKTTYEGAFCPNCGTPANQTPAPTYPTPPQKKGNSALGILALIFSILGCTNYKWHMATCWNW